MSISSDRRVLQPYVDYLNRICNRIITDCRLTVIQGVQTSALVTCFQDGGIRPLKLDPSGWLHLRQGVNVESGRVVVQDCIYRYSLSDNPDDEDQWIFRYEYALAPPQHVPHSHLHINAAKDGQPLRHIHFPTGRVSLEQIISLLIIEYKVTSRICDWFDVLADSHQGFTERRTDLQTPHFP